MNKFTGLIILDGFGLAPESPSNAISKETAPNMTQLMASCTTTTLEASGMSVGLPEGQMGNSEVGHLNIGAGRVIYQELTRITKSIKDGDFFENKAFIKACENAKKSGRKLHLLGLLSDGGVHSNINHLFALLDMAKQQGVKNAYVHCFLDGRDVAPSSGKAFLKELQDYIDGIGYGKIATICGRFYAMDRDNIWERVEKAYTALTTGEGVQEKNAIEAITNSYKKGITDEFVLPTIITRCGKPIATVAKNDSIIFFNFRPDRARMITRSLIMADFDSFERKTGFLAPEFVSFTQYDVKFNDYLQVAYKPQSYKNTLGEYLSSKGISQFRIAETQKYAHVTFFFNGGVEKENKGEERILIDSPKIATFDLKPEMSAYEVAAKACEVIASKKYDVMILNFANCDMVGHTGIMQAAKQAVKFTDECLIKVLEAIKSIGGQALITADHGNADIMIAPNGEPFTAHTTNPVPLVYVGDKKIGFRKGGILADIAPTMLEIMGVEIPSEMTGQSLIVRHM